MLDRLNLVAFDSERNGPFDGVDRNHKILLRILFQYPFDAMQGASANPYSLSLPQKCSQRARRVMREKNSQALNLLGGNRRCFPTELDES